MWVYFQTLDSVPFLYAYLIPIEYFLDYCWIFNKLIVSSSSPTLIFLKTDCAILDCLHFHINFRNTSLTHHTLRMMIRIELKYIEQIVENIH